jgi:hypothetical protein
VHGEFAENEVRENFTLSEAVAIKAAVEPMLKAEAKERQRVHGGTSPGKHSGQLGQSVIVRDKVAKRTGRKRTRILPVLRSSAGEIGKKIWRG